MTRVTSTEAFKQQFAAKALSPKTFISDEDFTGLLDAAIKLPGVVAASDSELRYIEGMFNLPFGLISGFWATPAKKSEKCVCGRVPNAFDIVMTAARKRIHDRETLRDTLLGYRNLLESSDSGRTGECFNCGRPITMAGYYKKGYMYAVV